MKWVYSLAVSAVVATVAGCGGGSETLSKVEANPGRGAFSEADPYTGANYDLPLAAPEMQMTASAIGPLGPAPTYSQKDVEAKLPGYETTTIQTAREDGVKWTLAALKNGSQVLQLFKGPGTRISEIHAVSGIVAGPNGEQVDMTFRQAGLRRSECRVGRNLWRGMAVCPSRGARNVKLVFALPGYRGPYDRMPDDSKIGDATLQRMVWTPPS